MRTETCKVLRHFQIRKPVSSWSKVMEIVDTTSLGFIRFGIVGFIYTLNENWDGIARDPPSHETPRSKQRNRAFSHWTVLPDSVRPQLNQCLHCSGPAAKEGLYVGACRPAWRFENSRRRHRKVKQGNRCQFIRKPIVDSVSQLFRASSFNNKTQPLDNRRLVFRIEHALQFADTQHRQQRCDGFSRTLNSSNAGCIPDQIECRSLRRADEKWRWSLSQLLCWRSFNIAFDEKLDLYPSRLYYPAWTISHHLHDLQGLRI